MPSSWWSHRPAPELSAQMSTPWSSTGDPVGLGPELALALRHRVEAGLPLLALGSVPA
jgi:hypothetical protein